MTKIAFIGASSFDFTHKLVKRYSHLSLPEDAKLVIMDIDADQRDYIKQVVDRIIDEGDCPTKASATIDS